MYPNGNGAVRGNYLSVFVEMYKGWSNFKGSYEYKIELLGRRDRNKVVSRNFISDFETSVSWGYNRFIKLELLEKEGYWDPDEDVVNIVFLFKLGGT